jgi:hypothetical protein
MGLLYTYWCDPDQICIRIQNFLKSKSWSEQQIFSDLQWQYPKWYCRTRGPYIRVQVCTACAVRPRLSPPPPPPWGGGLDLAGSGAGSSRLSAALLGHFHQAELGCYTGTDGNKCQFDAAVGKVKTTLQAAAWPPLGGGRQVRGLLLTPLNGGARRFGGGHDLSRCGEG